MACVPVKVIILNNTKEEKENMKKMRWFLITAALCLCSAFMADQSVVRAAASPISICSDEEWEVLRLVNEERMERGLQPLSVYSKLQSVGDIRAKETAELFSHSRPDGSSCFSALKEKDISYNCAGENIAAGYVDSASVVEGWMNSPGHRANILTESYNHIGIGYYYSADSYYGRYWTQMFIGSCTPTSIVVKGAGTVSTYERGTTIKKMDRILMVKCEHGTSYMPLTSEMCSGYRKNNAGTQTVKVKYGGKTTTFKVKIKGISIAKATVTGIRNKTYTGKNLTQTVKVVLDGKTLVKNKDYTISYTNNKNAGTATVIIKGKGLYSGSIRKTFQIQRRSLTGYSISKIKDQVYTGRAVTPKVTVTYKGKVISTKNYKLTYRNNVKAGTATVIVKGTGNFKGTLTRTFKIVKKTT